MKQARVPGTYRHHLNIVAARNAQKQYMRILRRRARPQPMPGRAPDRRFTKTAVPEPARTPEKRRFRDRVRDTFRRRT